MPKQQDKTCRERERRGLFVCPGRRSKKQDQSAAMFSTPTSNEGKDESKLAESAITVVKRPSPAQVSLLPHAFVVVVGGRLTTAAQESVLLYTLIWGDKEDADAADASAHGKRSVTCSEMRWRENL